MESEISTKEAKKGDCECEHFVDAAYVGIAESFEGLSVDRHAVNHEGATKDFGYLHRAHQLVLGVLAANYERNAGKLGQSSESISRRILLTSAFIQGLSLCEYAIKVALYGQAGALLRQEMECLSAVTENVQDRRNDGRTPNVKFAPWKMARKYGDLSDIAHLSNHRLLVALYTLKHEWGDYGSISPQYNAEVTKWFYGTHLATMLGIAVELDQLYQEMYGVPFEDRDYAALWVANDILVAEGVLVDPKTKKESQK